jgi:hypothetical protein
VVVAIVGRELVEALAEGREGVEVALSLGGELGEGFDEGRCTIGVPTPDLVGEPVVDEVSFEVVARGVALVGEVLRGLGDAREDAGRVLYEGIFVGET